jgi:hypothetical protein
MECAIPSVTPSNRHSLCTSLSALIHHPFRYRSTMPSLGTQTTVRLVLRLHAQKLPACFSPMHGVPAASAVTGLSTPPLTNSGLGEEREKQLGKACGLLRARAQSVGCE